MIPIAILDLCPIVEGGTPAQSFRHTLELAQNAQAWGYKRYWLAEHHGMPGIASSATPVLMGYIASATEHMMIGAGGVMLPNHSPLVVAETYATLAALYPGRIELGLGRAPGADPVTARALRRHLDSDPQAFPADVKEVLAYFRGDTQLPVQAYPGAGTDISVWILGSSLFGARLAAKLGLPYSFASHFAPSMLMQALDVYRSEFEPSAYLDKPYVMLGYNVFIGECDEEGMLLASSAQQSFLSLRLGKPKPLPRPKRDFYINLGPREKLAIEQTLGASAIGSPQTVREQMQAFILQTQANELIVSSSIYDQGQRLRSYELLAQIALPEG